MKKLILFCCLLLFGFSSLYAQSSQRSQTLYIPRNIQQAYQNGTRSKDGTPGPNYWQNHANYYIHLRVNPPNRTIHGSEGIEYFNESPDTLNVLVFELFMNKHKPGAARPRQVPKAIMTSGIHIDKYVENGETRQWNDDHDGVWKAVKLEEPLMPGDSIQLSVKWHYKLTKRAGGKGG